MPPLPQSVAFGIPMAEALAEATRRLSMRQVVVVTTNSLAGPGGLAETVGVALGSNLRWIVAGVRAHTPREDVTRLAAALKGADGVVTIGGGSVCDAVKVARLCLANGVADPADLERLAAQGDGKSAKPGFLPFVAIPTTLSAGEFTPMGGVTEAGGSAKKVHAGRDLAPDIVILDPEMTRATPPRLWLSTGVRAIDHAVETWCSTGATPLSDAQSLHAARLLIPALRRSFDAPQDMHVRLDCLNGAWLSILGAAAGVRGGASHGIGHALGGTAGMPHGETSCVMLPHVLRYNATVNSDRQAFMAAAIDGSAGDLPELIASLVSHLGLPGRLRDAGVSEAMLPKVAETALASPLVAANPRPLSSAAGILEILKEAW